MTDLKLSVMASGRGSNFAAIIKAIETGCLNAEVKLLMSNNSDAGALTLAKEKSIPAVVVNRKAYGSRELFVKAMLAEFKKQNTDLIVLAGYMKKIPPEVIAAYPNRIVNIHPALLPSFGGQGMYGHFVHEAVLAEGCKVSGVTVHLVDAVYDRGPIIAQRCVPVHSDDTPDALAARVLIQEHKLYSECLQWFADNRVNIRNGVVSIASE